MHILWASDSPLYPSAYGAQTALITPLLQKLGHKITIYSPSHIGMPIMVNGVKLVGSVDAQGYNPAALFDLHASRLGADILLTVKDPYVYDPGIMRNLKVPWVAIAPIDTEPVCDANKEVLEFASAVIAVTKHGAGALYSADIEPAYVPHAFDARVFDIQPREEARTKHGLPQDVFIALFVGDNRTYPSRKNIENMIAAWAMFIVKHPESVLILHTMLTVDRGGLDVQAILKAYNIPDSNVFVSDQYQLAFGFPQSYMASLYNAADVLLLPSTGEGFGMPIIEATLCGTPVIGTDWTAMRETVFFGTKIPTTSDVRIPAPTGQLEIVPFGGFRFRPNPLAIYASLEKAVEHRATGTDRETGRRYAMKYEVERVVQKYWEPTLIELDQLLVKGHANGLLPGLPGDCAIDSGVSGGNSKPSTDGATKTTEAGIRSTRSSKRGGRAGKQGKKPANRRHVTG
jgi:glycosyltransferase involved in cell wall biosynthesis